MDLAKTLALLRLFVVETVCVLEICMPPSFFDLMEHMLIHLVDDVENCGPMGGRWALPIGIENGCPEIFGVKQGQTKASIASGSPKKR